MILYFQKRWLVAAFIAFSLQNSQAEVVEVIGPSDELMDAVTFTQSEIEKKIKAEVFPKFCHKDGYFKNCYSGMTTQRCQDQMLNLLPRCQTRAEVPSKIWAGVSAAFYGAKIGSCLGREFHKLNQNEFSQNSKCQNQDHWMASGEGP